MARLAPYTRSVAIAFRHAQDSNAGHALCSRSQQPCWLSMPRWEGWGGRSPHCGGFGSRFFMLVYLPLARKVAHWLESRLPSQAARQSEGTCLGMHFSTFSAEGMQQRQYSQQGTAERPLWLPHLLSIFLGQ